MVVKRRVLYGEPLAIIAAVVTIANVLVQLAVSFGWDLTQDQNTAVSAIVSAVAGLATVLLVRPKVTPIS